jgi:hypothetical protein
MRWNPLLNAAGAVAYIAAVAGFLQFVQSFKHDTPDTIFDSMGALSLIVLSAAIMAFLFFYRPVTLLLEEKREAALTYFLKTLGAFALITALLLSVLIAV